MSSPATAPHLVTVAGDGTFAAPAEDGGRFDALVSLRALLGEDLEEQIGAEMYLPAALGGEAADQLLPASLALLAGTTGDLASYGWRMGPGAGRAWHRAHELRGRTLEDARIALLGFEGPLRAASLGPLSLAAATYLRSGERTLADRGALRDLPVLLAEGLAELAAAIPAHVPGAAARLLVREDSVRAVHRGLVPTPSGYRRYAALPAPEIGTLWRAMLEALAGTGIAADAVRLQIPADAELLAAARTAGARSLAIAPSAIGPLSDAAARPLWEAVAEAREAGVDLAMVLHPQRVAADLDLLATTWSRLGYGPADLAGLTLMAHRPSRAADPAAQPAPGSQLAPEDIARVVRAAPAWAGRIDA